MKLAMLCAAVALAFPAAAGAQAAADPAAQAAAPATATATPMTDGEVRRIDKAQGKVTLRHGPIAHLEMPGMTMVFKVAEARLLDPLNEGDKVRFAAAKVNGAIVVTAIEVAK